MSADIALAAFAALIAFIFLASVSAWLASKPIYATWAIFGLIILNASKIPMAVNVGILIYPEDLFFIVLAIACLIRFSLIVSTKTVPLAWWIIGLVQLVLVVWGLQTYGTAAGVDYRDHFYLWVAFAYFCSIKWTEPMIARVVNAWIMCAVGLCLLTYYRWIGSAVDPAYAQKVMELDTTGPRFRVIGSDPTLVIGIAFLFLFFKRMVGKLGLYERILMPMMLLTVFVLQHRSVWASVLIGMACLLWVMKRKRKGSKAIIAVALVAVPLAIFLVIPGKGNGVLDSITNSASQAFSTEEGTMVGRVTNWQQLLSKWVDSKNPVTYLIGNPYGSGFNPYDVVTEFGPATYDMVPHNHFVHALYRGGLIGLLATLYIFYQVWASAVKGLRQPDRPWAPYFVAVFAAMLSYYIPYWATYGHGIFFGIAISYFGIARTRRLRQVPISFEQPGFRTGNY